MKHASYLAADTRAAALMARWMDTGAGASRRYSDCERRRDIQDAMLAYRTHYLAGDSALDMLRDVGRGPHAGIADVVADMILHLTHDGAADAAAMDIRSIY